MSEAAAIDSITASVVQGALENIAVEMGYKLMRMSYSSIIRESEDFGAALVDAAGRGLAESAQSTPLQSGPIPGYIRGILKALEARGDRVRPGDVIMHNDAYGGASHGPDVAFAVPMFHDGRLVAFAATTAHHLDIGALSPGSCGIVDAIDAYAEKPSKFTTEVSATMPSGSYCGTTFASPTCCRRYGGADCRGTDRRRAARRIDRALWI